MAEVAETKPVRFGALSASEAGKKGAEARKRTLAERASSAPHANAAARDLTRSPLDALRDLMAASPDKYAAGLAKLVEQGDPRSMAIITNLFKVDETVRVPRAERLVRELDRDQRHALMLELEQRGCTLPTLPIEATSDDAEGRVQEGEYLDSVH